jgi:predicted amidophosphoribosyltransferase
MCNKMQYFGKECLYCGTTDTIPANDIDNMQHICYDCQERLDFSNGKTDICPRCRQKRIHYHDGYCWKCAPPL